MTVILGINLSDRVYVSGDSRVSYYAGDERRTRHDNMQKVELMPGTKNVTIASAGDARLAQHILSELKKAPFIKDGIMAIRENIKPWLTALVDEYFKTHPFSTVAFIVGGTDEGSKKTIDGKKWRDMASAYTGGSGPIFVKNEVNDVLGPGKPVPDGEIHLNIDNTVLFGIRVSQYQGVTIEDANWGEFLIYGPDGLVKEDIELKDIGDLEMGVPGVPGGSHDSHDAALIPAFILTQAKKRDLGSVGGAVITLQNKHNGQVVVVAGSALMYPIKQVEALKEGESLMPEIHSEIAIENGRFYRVEHGTRYKMTPVSQYKADGKHELFI